MAAEYEQLGLVAHVCASAKVNRTVLYLNQWVIPAIRHKQMMFVFDRSGVPIGFWTWAWLAVDVEVRLRSKAEAMLHPSEWNEGGAYWVMDLVSCGGHLIDMVAYIRSALSKEAKIINLRYQDSSQKNRRLTWSTTGLQRYDEFVARSSRSRLPRSAFAISHSHWLADLSKPRVFF